MGLRCSFAATGDSFITRRLPEGGYPGFSELRALIAAHDVRFNNLETTVHRSEGIPSAFSGGTWAMTDPSVFNDLLSFSFNIYNTANNHSLDYGYGGLLSTLRYLQESNIPYAGTGKNLFEASRPAYIETKEARVAAVCACSTFNASAAAGSQSPAMEGRPGLNPLRFSRTVTVESGYLEALKDIAEKTRINAGHDLSIANGFAGPVPAGLFYFDGTLYREGTENRISTKADERDADRILSAIKEGRTQADYVILSIHSHEFSGGSIMDPAGFFVDFAHDAIDAGASAVIGHGPHELRGIEIYKGKPVFYSLGNFIFQSDTVDLQPSDAFENASMSSGAYVGEYMDKRSRNDTSGFPVQPNIWRSVIASFQAEDGDIREVRLHPITLDGELPRSRRGWPRLVRDDSILEHLAALSAPFGTEIAIEDGTGVIRI